MKFQRLVLNNYGSYYGEHAINLSGLGLVLVLGQNHDDPRANSNGAGKSTPWEAFDWCLWGTVPKGDHVDSVINEEAGKSCWVAVHLQDDAGYEVTVVRFRKWKDAPGGKETGLKLLVVDPDSGVQSDQTCLDMAETQRKLEAILGLDREVFHAAILFGQNDNWRFADGTDAERIEILTRVLQLGEIDVWLDKAKKLEGQASLELGTMQQQLAGYQASLSSLQAVDFARQISEWETGRATHLMQIDAKIMEVQAQAREIRSRIANEAETMERLRTLEANAPVEPKLPDGKVEAEAETQIKAQIMATERRAQEIEQRVKHLQTSWTGTCAECGQVVAKDHIDREAARLGLELLPLANAVQKWRQDLQVVVQRRESIRQEYTNQMAVYRGWIGKHAQDKAEIQKVLWQAQELRKQANEADAYVVGIQQDRQAAVVQQNPFVAKQAEVQQQIDAVRVQLMECEGRINGLTERMKVLNFWVEAFGPKGLKNYILDTRLQEMTDAANQWVKLLTGGTCWVRFETQTMGRSGKLANKLNIRVFQYQRSGQIIERNYKSLSGGQKARIRMGVDFGLSRLVAARARQRYDVLVLDEVFKHLDRAGREAVIEILHELRKEKSSVIVIDHDAEFGALFENVLWVDYQNHRSTIREVRGVNAATQPPRAVFDGSSPNGSSVSTGQAQAPGG